MPHFENDERAKELSSLLGEPPLLPGESENRYQALRAEIEKMIAPKNIVEQMRVQDLTDTIWEQLRYKRFEAKLIESAKVNALAVLMTPFMSFFRQHAASVAHDYYSPDPKKSEPAARLVARYGITTEMIYAKAASIEVSNLAMFDRLIGNRQAANRVMLNDQERRERKAKKLQHRLAKVAASSDGKEPSAKLKVA
jgi:hypothetical protein